ncbi:MAG: hypothetical protein QOH68_3060 [Nocardioidaceae bacterium]|jgi:hypothetical protein|nr:hypothetical protein [Nocardioidaceae bacterium]
MFFQLLNHVANPIVRIILRSPLHPVLSGQLALLSYTRGNGRSSTIPVGYTLDGDVVRVSVGAAEHKRWWRAVRRDPDVEMVVRGARRTGRARVTVGDTVMVDVDLGGRVSAGVP